MEQINKTGNCHLLFIVFNKDDQDWDEETRYDTKIVQFSRFTENQKTSYQSIR